MTKEITNRCFYIDRWETLSPNDVLKISKKYPNYKFYTCEGLDGWFFLGENKRDAQNLIYGWYIELGDYEHEEIYSA